MLIGTESALTGPESPVLELYTWSWLIGQETALWWFSREELRCLSHSVIFFLSLQPPQHVSKTSVCQTAQPEVLCILIESLQGQKCFLSRNLWAVVVLIPALAHLFPLHLIWHFTHMAKASALYFGGCVQALSTSLKHNFHGTTLDLLLVSNQRSGACGLTSLCLSFVLSNMELIVSGWQDGAKN